MGEIRIVNRRGNKNRFPSSTETTNTTETIPETPSTPIQIQEDIKMMTKMTYEEIKNALAAGKVFSRVGKNKSRTEVKLSGGKPVRRYISESGEVSDWAPAALNTMPRFEWEVSQSEPTTEVKPTTTIIKQVDLGDGTTTVITETVPVSEAPVVIDPFAIPLNKDNDTPEPEPVPETDNMPSPEPEVEEIPTQMEEPKMDEPIDAIEALRMMKDGYAVMWIPNEKDHDLQVKVYIDWDGKVKSESAQSTQVSECLEMNEFLSHKYVVVKECLDSFFGTLECISNYDFPCFMRNIVTGKIIRGPKCVDDSCAEADEDCNIYPVEPFEIGTILPIELRTFWTICIGEVE